MMKKFLSLLSVNATMLSVVSFTVSCKEKKDINVNLNLKEIFESKPKNIDIGIAESILTIVNDKDKDVQKFEINKRLDDYFKNLQFIALSVLNKIEKTCFLNTSSIAVNLYRDSDRKDKIENNDDLKKEDIVLHGSIYISFSTIVQNGESENNNFENLLRLDFVEHDKGLFNMEKTPQQQPYCESKNHEL